jgi:hypothetical protein
MRTFPYLVEPPEGEIVFAGQLESPMPLAKLAAAQARAAFVQDLLDIRSGQSIYAQANQFIAHV